MIGRPARRQAASSAAIFASSAGLLRRPQLGWSIACYTSMISSTASAGRIIVPSARREMRAPARQRVVEARGETAPLAGAEEAAEDERAAMRGDGQPVAVVGRLLEADAQPIGLEAPRPALAAHADALDRQRILD